MGVRMFWHQCWKTGSLRRTHRFSVKWEPTQQRIFQLCQACLALIPCQADAGKRCFRSGPSATTRGREGNKAEGYDGDVRQLHMQTPRNLLGCDMEARRPGR
jgi:hypothetical protein